MPGLGGDFLAVIFGAFAVTTMITYAYYSLKCARYLLGERIGGRFVWIYLGTIPLAAVSSPAMTVNMIDTAYALMVVPNLLATMLLAPRVLGAMRDYFARLEQGDFATD